MKTKIVSTNQGLDPYYTARRLKASRDPLVAKTVAAVGTRVIKPELVRKIVQEVFGGQVKQQAGQEK